MSEANEIIISESADLKARNEIFEDLYNSLSKFMGVAPDRSPGHFITTAIGALEYASAVARQAEVSLPALHDALDNIWKRYERGQAEEGAIREQGQI